MTAAPPPWSAVIAARWRRRRADMAIMVSTLGFVLITGATGIWLITLNH